MGAADAKTKRAAGALAAAAVLGVAACVSTPTPRPTTVAQAPSPHVIQMMGYDEAVQLGAVYAQEMGYPNPSLEDVSPQGANLWRVRYGVQREGTRKQLVLEFDSASRMLVKAEEESGVTAKAKPVTAAPGTENKGGR